MTLTIVDIFKNDVSLGDRVSLHFADEEGRYDYSGEVIRLNETAVVLKNTREMGLFESLAYPQVIQIDINSIFIYAVFKPDGSSFAR
ncbi:hypothetical protein M5X00_13235 [Paenibacillus alvei]|uniref:hypothetical protein n=1 Tax=Paenibacillus alvei TaxID=44250 RepID=UPI000289B71D|nr:hypothetical protein [Paenibacillus alvei]EJW13782.1 hypothetical protein PAV_109p00120 [Paenibacillus alvei DSM 29]MCY9540513.1 hypothetical protein [Paenibacillus alvei]MCY9708283.1 hypothetical protein [Paenibacillus alvei]MCY9732922.1 hypothetical protein [Paenibacillus alvei]MCY9755204.1 hypothetical protein [Paenibacillus alvei]